MYRFKPQLQERIWGGNRIARFKSGVTSSSQTIGESWELSGIEGNISIVEGGRDHGMSLKQLLERDGERLVGRKVYEQFGCEFPLLIKFIDAANDLSIQVHPDEKIAQELHHKHGKSEMWYVIDAEQGSRLLAGFNHDTSAEQVASAISEGSILQLIKSHTVKAGDSFYLPAGCIHSIGRGVFLAEIQQTSDLTYRVYDYDRRDKWGNPRELHIDHALKALDYSSELGCRCQSQRLSQSCSRLVSCQHFTVESHTLDAKQRIQLSERDSFTVFIVTSGKAEITSYEGERVEREEVVEGDTILIPAHCQEVVLNPITEQTILLDCHIG